MKKILLIIIFLLLTGCGKYTDLNNLAIIKSIGISHNDTYTIYAQIIDNITKDNEVQVKVIKSSDSSLDNAIQKIKLQVNKEIYFSHLDLIIFDYNLKNNNYQEIIKYFINNNRFRNDFLCIFSKNIENILANSQYDEIELFLKMNQENKGTIYKRFEKVIQEYLDNNFFSLSDISYNSEITFEGNYRYNKKTERVIHEKN